MNIKRLPAFDSGMFHFGTKPEKNSIAGGDNEKSLMTI
jgi:hypothetical protein